MKKKLQRVSFFLSICLFLGVVYFAVDAYLFLYRPASKDPKEVTFSVDEGATFLRIVWDLKKAGVITDVDKFCLLGEYKEAIAKIQAGDYLLNTGWTPLQVLKHLTSGKTILYKLVLPEGLSWWETAKAIEKQGFALYDDLKDIFFDKAFLEANYIFSENIEGFLYPETYLLRKPKVLNKEQARKITSLLVQTFWKKNKIFWEQLAKENAGGAALLAQTPAEVDFPKLLDLLSLASLVEKETSIAAERPRVAGVYANRLSRGMLLQADPTIPYGIGENFQGPITRLQIQDRENLYNTYQHLHLPGPICSVGRLALEAAVAPEKHDYLYFVATGLGGGHVFTKNLGAHNAAVQQYRQNLRLKSGGTPQGANE